jgi:hypothetical protein
VGRRKPTEDGFCGRDVLKIAFVSIWRRNDGRCAGNNKFFDFLLGSDSEKEAIDPSYNNPFLNRNQAAAEQHQEVLGQLRQGSSPGRCRGLPGGVFGVLGGGAVGCGQEVLVEYVRQDDEEAADILSTIFNTLDVRKVHKTFPKWIRSLLESA